MTERELKFLIDEIAKGVVKAIVPLVRQITEDRLNQQEKALLDQVKELQGLVRVVGKQTQLFNERVDHIEEKIF